MKSALRAETTANATCSAGQGVRRSGASGGPSGSHETEQQQRMLELLPLVRSIARGIHSRLPRHVQFDDCFQAGVLGLINAFRRFNPRKKVHLESFVAFRIRGAIFDELRSLDWGSREMRKKARQMEHAKQQLRGRLGRNPMENELAAEMRIPLLRLHSLRSDLRGLDLKSLQEGVAITKDGSKVDYCSQLAASESSSPWRACANEEERAKLAAAIRSLPLQQQRVITLYYHSEMSMKEVGEALAVGESRVSQIHSLAIARLRVALSPQANAGSPTALPAATAVPPGSASLLLMPTPHARAMNRVPFATAAD
jgi:RNA polymerase sigma factor for flagellar operon FliA